MLGMLRGPSGHPSHPPMTDATIGTWTACFFSLLLAIWWPDPFGVVALVTAAMGIAFAIAAIGTGLLDYLVITSGTPLRRTATWHMIVMLVATTLFVVTTGLLATRYDVGEALDPTIAATTTGVAAYLVLALGGWIGGTIVFVHGMRVESEPEKPTSEAIKP